MCGICGVVTGRPEVVDEALLCRMADTMRHRGPDDEGYAVFPGAGLGFRRLSIIDVEGSHQPIHNEDSTVWSVCNGEIYNYRELRKDLAQKGHVFQTNGDAETVVHAYEEWGRECFTHLRGMFAIAIWDTSRKRLLLARDRLGIKPLYYSFCSGTLVFGSELKSVMASGIVSTEIEWQAIDLYLSLMYVPSPLTVYSDVKKLSPGRCLVFDCRDVHVEPYWAPPEEDDVRDEAESAEKLLHLLRESMLLHLRSDVPLGFFLSGGLDSSTMVALAAAVGSGRPRTFSVGFETRSHNELGYARKVAEVFDCEHSEFEVRADAAEIIPGIAAQCDEPFGDSSAVPSYYVCKAAAGSVKVVVGGDGGDELFAGYEWTRRQRFIDRWNRSPTLVRNAAAALFRGRESAAGIGRFARFFDDAGRSGLDGYCRRVSCFTVDMKHLLYDKGLLPQIAHDHSKSMLAGYFGASMSDLTVAMNRADLGVYLPGDDLCKVDRMTMMHSLEGRVPILDHKIAEFALSLPMSLKMRGLTSKFILKKAMSGILPPVILRQRKQGFAIPVAKWMREDLYNDTCRLLLSREARQRGLFRGESVKHMLTTHRDGKANYGHQLWVLLMLEVWFRVCVDGGRDASSAEGIALSDL